MSQIKKGWILIMKRKNILRKSIGVFVAAILLAVSMNSTVFAVENDKVLYNVSVEMPEEEKDEGISIYGLSKPSTSSCVNLNKESLEFAGYAERSTLYTNKHFTGKSSIRYSITNDSDETLTVKFYTSDGWFKTKKIVVAGNATLTGTISGLDSDELYYLTFSAPSDFYGYVK